MLKLLGLGKEKVEVIDIKTEMYKDKKVRMVYLKSMQKKSKCNKCGEYTKTIHDTLEPSKINYLDIAGWQCILNISKRRFYCKKCDNRFVEEFGFIKSKCNISNKTKIKIHTDLKKYNLSINYIAEINHVSPSVVLKELEEIAESYPPYLRQLPEVISLDEFKADTKEGKYAFIINDPIKKEVLDILPNRKKDYLINNS